MGGCPACSEAASHPAQRMRQAEELRKAEESHENMANEAPSVETQNRFAV